MRLLSTRTRANELAKDKNKSRCGSQVQEEGHRRLLSTRTITNEVEKHKNKGHMSLLSTRTNEVAKHKNKGK